MKRGKDADLRASSSSSRLELLPPSCLFVSVCVCLLVMTVMYAIGGFPWAAALLWLPVLVLVALYIASFWSNWAAVVSRIFGGSHEAEEEARS